MPRRLNLGCGFDHRPGHLNVDFLEAHHPDLRADVRDLSMLPSDSFEAAVAQDVLEHLKRVDVVPALREWRRVLAPGGLLEIRTLDVIGAADLLRQRDGTAFHQHMINCLYGTQAYTGDYHLVGFTDLTLVDDLFEAGFDRVRISRRDQWLLDARARRPSGRDQPDWIAIGLDSGFYMQESDGRDSWRWCDAVAGILLFSRYREAVDVHLQLDLFRPTGEIEIELTGCGVGQRVPVGRSTTVSSTRTLIPGSNRLSLMSHGEAVPSREDPRSLHVQLRAIRATPVL